MNLTLLLQICKCSDIYCKTACNKMYGVPLSPNPSPVSWDDTPCRLVTSYQCQAVSLNHDPKQCTILRIKTTQTFETPVTIYQSTRRTNPEFITLQEHHRDNLTSLLHSTVFKIPSSRRENDYAVIQGVSFIVSPSTATLSQRKPASVCKSYATCLYLAPLNLMCSF